MPGAQSPPNEQSIKELHFALVYSCLCNEDHSFRRPGSTPLCATIPRGQTPRFLSCSREGTQFSWQGSSPRYLLHKVIQGKRDPRFPQAGESNQNSHYQTALAGRTHFTHNQLLMGRGWGDSLFPCWWHYTANRS